MDPNRIEPIGDSYQYNPDYHRTAEFLGVNKYDRGDFETAQKISLLKDWADKESSSKTLEDSLYTIDSLRKKVGTQVIGKTLVNQLYQYVRLGMGRNISNKRVAPKNIKKSKAPSKQNPLGKVIQATVQNSIADMAKKALSDKKLISNTIQNVMKESFK